MPVSNEKKQCAVQLKPGDFLVQTEQQNLNSEKKRQLKKTQCVNCKGCTTQLFLFNVIKFCFMTTPVAAAEEKNLRRESGLTIAATKEEKEVCLNTHTTNQPALKSVTIHG